MSEAIAAIITALIGAAVSIGGTIFNNVSQSQTNERNKQEAEKLTREQWARDDTSLQRQVEDAKAAGLSPLAVTGAMQSSAPIMSAEQSSQMDLSSILGMLTSSSGLLGQGLSRQADRKESARQFNAKLNSDINQFNQSLEQKNDEISKDILKFNKTMQYQYDVLNRDTSKYNSDSDFQRYSKLSDSSVEMYKSVCSSLGVTPQFQPVQDLAQYESMLDDWMSAYARAVNNGQYKFTGSNMSSSTSSSQQAGTGGSLFGTGLNVSESSSSSSSVTMDDTLSAQYDFVASYLNGRRFPVFMVPRGDSVGDYSYSPIK